ncbi:helix-turn-helix domain-containing protein [Dermabacteraceae bacterium P13115]
MISKSRGVPMASRRIFSYKPLWKLLIDKELNKTQLQDLAGLSLSTMVKLGKGDNVTTDVLALICKVIDCDISDICEIVPAESTPKTTPTN